nr:immunoglobulin heavy chain junction region [Macaca mulatta]MOV55063.1 immunoglobulin heavy chain junction region [Macaca mulatta]MOV57545.1 immunoglobulin heavy chain junction region [Macaca mulatta]MOV59251.1 immunoglobulin heavy chain junction region [Macaca mulatta]MOV59792.1 immunoglobulin heavy chain junction region [Macaca mulatta]
CARAGFDYGAIPTEYFDFW